VTSKVVILKNGQIFQNLGEKKNCLRDAKNSISSRLARK